MDIENIFNERLQQYSLLLPRLGLEPPYQLIAGLTGIKGRRLQRPPPPGQMRLPGRLGPQCLAETVEQHGEYDGRQNLSSALDTFFKTIFHVCGVERWDSC